jgi:hypothetical protein
MTFSPAAGLAMNASSNENRLIARNNDASHTSRNIVRADQYQHRCELSNCVLPMFGSVSPDSSQELPISLAQCFEQQKKDNERAGLHSVVGADTPKELNQFLDSCERTQAAPNSSM